MGGKVKMTEVINVTGQKVEMIKDIKDRSRDAFVYLDPPYYPTAKTKDGKVSPYKLYNGNDYVPVDFLKLKLRCDELTMNGIPFVLSNSDCEFIRVLFKDYIFVEISEARSLSRARSPEKCLLITNFKQKKDFMESVKNMNKMGVGK